VLFSEITLLPFHAPPPLAKRVTRLLCSFGRFPYGPRFRTLLLLRSPSFLYGSPYRTDGLSSSGFRFFPEFQGRFFHPLGHLSPKVYTRSSLSFHHPNLLFLPSPLFCRVIGHFFFQPSVSVFFFNREGSDHPLLLIPATPPRSATANADV